MSLPPLMCVPATRELLDAVNKALSNYDIPPVDLRSLQAQLLITLMKQARAA